jgi:pimeloyl-ACP methyl ester carboxylesterase
VTAAQPAWFSAALAAPAADESVTVGGARIRYRAWGEPGLPGAVLVHGTAAHARWWDHIGPLLQADGLRVAALSISGHGDSDWREHYSFDRWASEVMAVASAAGISGPPFVIGHSLGGHVALQAAARHGDALAGIVVIDSPMFEGPPPPGVAGPGRGLGPQRAFGSRAAILDRFRLIPEHPVLPCVREYVAENSVTRQPDGEWRWKFDQRLFAKMTDRPLPAAAAAQAGCRAAILRAEDGIMTPEMAGRLRGRLGPGVPVIVVPGGHHVMLAEPLCLMTALRAVLACWTC